MLFQRSFPMEIFWQDLRYSMRMLWKSPGFTLIAVVALALGIGANTAIFSVVNAVVLRPLPYPSPEKLVWIWETSPVNEIKQEVASYPNFNDWRQQNQSFEGMAAFAGSYLFLTSPDGTPERLSGAVVVGDFFKVLGVQPMLGRTFLPEENQGGNQRAVILSHGLWQQRFGGKRELLEQTVMLQGNPFTVVGIMPPQFQHPQPGMSQPPQLWIPLDVKVERARRGDFLGVVARLKPSVSIEQARAEMATIAGRLEHSYPATNAGWSTIVLPLHERFVGDFRRPLVLMLGAVGFLLLIACANVANLLLARATMRFKEIAVRTALGARRGRIVRQLLTEHVLLALMGGALGLLLAFWGIDALLALSPRDIPRLDATGIDRWVLLFTLTVSLGTGVIFGLLPALSASKLNLNELMKEGGRSSIESSRGNRLRNVLAVSEIALSLLLLVGAGLLVKSFLRLQDVKPGYNPSHVLTAELNPPASRYAENTQIVNFYDQLLTQLAAQPGVQSAGLTTALPLSGGGDVLAFSIEGQSLGTNERVPDAEARVVSPDYFRTMEIPLLRGRLLDGRDGPDAPFAMVISDSLVRRYFRNEDPLGKRITFGDPSAKDARWYNVVGVVGDVRQADLADEPYAQVYRSSRQVPRRAQTIVVRTAGDPQAFVETLRSQLSALDPQQALYNVRTAEQVVAESIAKPRFNMLLITIFAVVALLLAAVGIYGVISYTVTQRTHEIGIRMALGARPFGVFKMVVGQGLVLALIGVGAGLVASFGVMRLLSSLLFGVTPTDVVTLSAVSGMLIFIVVLASYLPARRATKVDPLVALRYE